MGARSLRIWHARALLDHEVSATMGSGPVIGAQGRRPGASIHAEAVYSHGMIGSAWMHEPSHPSGVNQIMEIAFGSSGHHGSSDPIAPAEGLHAGAEQEHEGQLCVTDSPSNPSNRISGASSGQAGGSTLAGPDQSSTGPSHPSGARCGPHGSSQHGPSQGVRSCGATAQAASASIPPKAASSLVRFTVRYRSWGTVRSVKPIVGIIFVAGPARQKAIFFAIEMETIRVHS